MRKIGRGVKSVGRGVGRVGVAVLEFFHVVGEAIKVGALIKGIASLFD